MVKPMKWVGFILTCMIAFSSFYIGFTGRNFGSHWDEWKLHSAVDNSEYYGVYQPGWYNYPSVSYWVCLVAHENRRKTGRFQIFCGRRDRVSHRCLLCEKQIRLFAISSFTHFWYLVSGPIGSAEPFGGDGRCGIGGDELGGRLSFEVDCPGYSYGSFCRLGGGLFLSLLLFRKDLLVGSGLLCCRFCDWK